MGLGVFCTLLGPTKVHIGQESVWLCLFQNYILLCFFSPIGSLLAQAWGLPIVAMHGPREMLEILLGELSDELMGGVDEPHSGKTPKRSKSKAPSLGQ